MQKTEDRIPSEWCRDVCHVLSSIASLLCRREWQAVYEYRIKGLDMSLNRRIFGVKERQGRLAFDLQDLPGEVKNKCKEADLTREEILAVMLYTGASPLVALCTVPSVLQVYSYLCDILFHAYILDDAIVTGSLRYTGCLLACFESVQWAC